MPDKTLRVVTYAAGASLAAITLIYVFGPTYFLDSDASTSGTGAFSTRKKGVVGLSNPANDCFINSVLQALAGLGDLRHYLIREIHRRCLDDESVYTRVVPASVSAQLETETALPRFGKDIPDWKLEGLQKGSVTKGLKEILDALNERPIHKKIISAAPFVRTLEEAFRQRISRQQQDAQEFLQVVAERLCDEYHAGRRARWLAGRTAVPSEESSEAQAVVAGVLEAQLPQPLGAAGRGSVAIPDRVAGAARGGVEYEDISEKNQDVGEEEGFPLEGRFESQIECLTCGFKPRPTASTFCTLTLNVPQVSSTTLGACFDGMFKTEYIDDFKCEKCRLLHALAIFESETQRSASDAARAKAQAAMGKLRLAIEADPEKPPDDVDLPDLRDAPKRRIARHIRMTEFPKILAIHLSRSIFNASHSSQKNSAKVAFPEQLPLGGLLQQRKYKLLGVVTHKGSHHSGHYESFRRQNTYPPFSNPSTFQASEVYSRKPSPAPTPRNEPQGHSPQIAVTPASAQGLSVNGSKTDLFPPSPYPAATPTGSTRDSLCANACNGEGFADPQGPASSVPSRVEGSDVGSSQGSTDASPRSSSPRTAMSPSRVAEPGSIPANDRPPSTRFVHVANSRHRKQQARWWRISDDKIKEASTRDVLGMQREVYLLFYEIERLHL
jgi:ubiquitin carboxyl-terminal hydrolase 16